MEGRVPRTEYDRATDPNASRSLRVVPAPAPAAGAEWSIAVPSAVWWDVLAIQQTLVTSASATNRTAFIAYTYYGTTFTVSSAATTQGASTTRGYTWVAGSVTERQNVSLFQQALPLDVGPLPPGSTVGSSTLSLAAGDQYSAISLLVREVLMVGLPGTPTATD